MNLQITMDADSIRAVFDGGAAMAVRNVSGKWSLQFSVSGWIGAPIELVKTDAVLLRILWEAEKLAELRK